MNQKNTVTSGKKQVRNLLINRDIELIRKWAGEFRNPLRVISSLLFEVDRLVVWRAIEAMGVVAAEVYKTHPERVKQQIRKLLWLMNDESGGICWNAPEAIGEILYNIPDLIDEFGMIIPSFFYEEPFEKGSRWAVSRYGALKPDLFYYAIEELIKSLDHDDAYIRGNTILALIALNAPNARAEIELLINDKSEIEIYDYSTGVFINRTIMSLAKEFMEL